MTIKDAVQNAVNEIVCKYGQVSPSDLVERARPKDSPIHDAFEWDDAAAGEQYRLWQARQWIKKVEIIHEDRTEKLFHVPAEAVERLNTELPSREGTYKPLSILVTDEDQFEAAKQEVLANIKGLQKSLHEMEAAFLKKSNHMRTKSPNFRKAKKGLAIIEEAITA